MIHYETFRLCIKPYVKLLLTGDQYKHRAVHQSLFLYLILP